MKFHPLYTDIELPKKFTYPFCYTPHPICIVAAELLKEHIVSDKELLSTAEQGKMFGVLVVRNKNGNVGFLAAYSGTTCHDFDNSYFVPPVFDYLHEDGFFKKGEREITEINHLIKNLEEGEQINLLRRECERVTRECDMEIEHFRLRMEKAKEERNKIREEGCTPEREEQLKDESRFMKAELKRMKLRREKLIAEKNMPLHSIMSRIEELGHLRRQKSDALQDKLFRHFEMLDKDGMKKDVCRIFEENGAGIPPAGTGECCAPKMIQYAFANGYELVAMAEFWYGKTPAAEIRHHLQYYPSCMGKCKPLLTYMLHGIVTDDNPLEHDVDESLDILYEDDYLCIINKPSGMPAVDGRINTKSAESIMRSILGNSNVKAVHRLDMDTSGILVFAKDAGTFVNMQKMFSERNVKKRYVAVLDGEVLQKNGRICLPLSPDYLNRPMQIVDFEKGKSAVTSFRVIASDGGRTRISLIPVTGRTHQLRVHCAHEKGLGTPIVGDNLYGTPSERLLLHASYIEFIHPATGQKISVKSNPDF